MHSIRRIRGTVHVVAALAALAISAPALEAQEPSSQAPSSQTPPSQTKEPFTQERFEALQSQGALILVDIYAPWCPDCALQQTALSRYREQNPTVALRTLVVDFDNQKSVVTAFRAPRQATLILFRGTERLWFAVAETRFDVIAQALNEGARKR
jgi:thiol:disulfide interchange protein